MSGAEERFRALTLSGGAAVIDRLRHIGRHESWPVARAQLMRLAVEQPGILAAAAMAAGMMLPDEPIGASIERLRATDEERSARGLAA